MTGMTSTDAAEEVLRDLVHGEGGRRLMASTAAAVGCFPTS